jgi:cytochrome P450
MDAPATAGVELFTSPETWANPYPIYRAIREQTPLAFGGHEGMGTSWLLLKHEHVYAALRDHATFSSESPGEDLKLVLLMDDPPRHTYLRRLVSKAFTPRRVAELGPWVTGVADELLDRIGPGETEMVGAYTVPLPVQVIARLMGIPGSEYHTFKHWSDAFLNSNGLPPDQRRASVMEMIGYFGKMAMERRAQGAEDLITALVQAEIEGEKLAEPEIIGFCILLLIAGNETTTNLISNMLNLLAQRPKLWDPLRADRSLIEPFIEESLRYESPVQFLQRRPTRDVELGGARIPAGCEVLIGFGAANRDPEAFDEPEEFRLDRGLSDHVAFGTGIHYCLGAPLARLEATITLNALLDRFTAIKPGSKPGTRQTATPIIYGFTKLPVITQHT